MDELNALFLSTFHAYSYGDINALESNIARAINSLVSWGFIVLDGEELKPTRIGKRVSELYLDPLTGYEYLKAFKRSSSRMITNLSLLFLAMNSIEASPLLTVRSKEIEEIRQELYRRESEIPVLIPQEYDIGYEMFINAFKTALMLEDWINEYSEEQILEKYNARPGDLYSKIEISDWLIYAMSELARIEGFREIEKKSRKLRVMLKYGVREELLQLVSLRGIGRVYARKLYSKGYTTISKLKKSSYEELIRIINRRDIVESICKQLGIKKAGLRDFENG